MKIWAKTIRDDKITRNIVHECEFLANDYLYGEALRDICEKMDIPTPISTVTNYIHFVRFNMTRYQVRDFVESVDFDYLTIECIPEDKQTKTTDNNALNTFYKRHQKGLYRDDTAFFCCVWCCKIDMIGCKFSVCFV